MPPSCTMKQIRIIKGLLPKSVRKKQIMYEQPGDPNCPVKSLKMYIEKLNPKCPFLFQKPKSSSVGLSPVWYENKPIGVHKLESCMKELSIAAGLSQVYTNHCLRATVSTVLSEAGCQSHNIMSVTGHKNEGSLASYVKEPSLRQRAYMCNILHGLEKKLLVFLEVFLALFPSPLRIQVLCWLAMYPSLLMSQVLS